MIVDAREETNRKTTAIESDTFTPTGKHLGMGCWGVVDEYEDPAGQKWAIKRFAPDEVAIRQMHQRKWTEEDVMRNEAVPLGGAEHNLVPRILERDKLGKLFVGMPVYDGGTLEGRKLELSRDFLARKEGLEKILGVTKDVANALGYLHRMHWGMNFGYREQRAHGDVKPANILMKDGNAYLADLGSSTCISISGQGSERGVHGDINYRAPECFDESARPSARADVWSLGAMLYEMTTGEGVYDGLETNSLTQKDIGRKIKKAPRKVRKVLEKCLSLDPSERFGDGIEARSALEKTIAGLDKWGKFKSYLKIAIPAMAMAGIFAYGGYKAETHEPTQLTIPEPQRIQGLLYPPGQESQDNIEFEFENIGFEKPATGWLISGKGTYARKATENRVVAYLLKCYAQAQECSRGVVATPHQDKTYKEYGERPPFNGDFQRRGLEYGNSWLVWAKSIEVALPQAKTKDGRVDLEDTMAIARVGTAKVMEAKRVARSEDYRDYSGAKDNRGDCIISKKDQDFIGNWLAYYHSNID